MFNLFGFGKDKYGTNRQIRVDESSRVGRSYDFRDNMWSSFVQLTLFGHNSTYSNNTPTGVYLDLYQISGANASSNAIIMTLKDGLASTTIETIVFPPATTFTKVFNPPLPQAEMGNRWSGQFTDINGTTDINQLGTLFWVTSEFIKRVSN